MVRRWESVTLDAGVGNDQNRARYWQRIEDKYHKLMSMSSLRSLRSLQGWRDFIKQTCSRWTKCIEQLRNAPTVLYLKNVLSHCNSQVHMCIVLMFAIIKECKLVWLFCLYQFVVEPVFMFHLNFCTFQRKS